MAGTPHRTVQPGRDAAETALQRCLGYGLCSTLVASPHEVDLHRLLQESGFGALRLPHGDGLKESCLRVAESGLDQLRAEYSGLFEVGDEGPPVPIQEALQARRPAGTREEVVRFYDHFGYALGENFAWQPDHLSVELEFMHFLCFHEAQVLSDEEALPFQLAQLDFTQRHLAAWLPRLTDNLCGKAPDALYRGILESVQRFVDGDVRWQAATILEATAGGVEGTLLPVDRHPRWP